jgi:hypothetical protein
MAVIVLAAAVIVLAVADSAPARSLGQRWAGTIDYHYVKSETRQGDADGDGQKTAVDVKAHWDFNQSPPRNHGPEDPTADANAQGHLHATGSYHDEAIPTTDGLACGQYATDDATGSTSFLDLLEIQRVGAHSYNLNLGAEVFPFNKVRRLLEMKGTSVPRTAVCGTEPFTTSFAFPDLIYISGPGIHGTTRSIRGTDTITRDCYTLNDPLFPLPEDQCRPANDPDVQGRTIHEVFTVTVNLHAVGAPAKPRTNPRTKPRSRRG